MHFLEGNNNLNDYVFLIKNHRRQKEMTQPLKMTERINNPEFYIQEKYRSEIKAK